MDDAAAAMRRVEEMIEARRFRDAVAPAKEACRLNPLAAGAWANYAIALKHSRYWEECLDACDRALELAPQGFAGTCWNAGIAATALERWGRARRAWRRYGLELPDDDGEEPLPPMGLGQAVVRVAIDSEPELVFCDRIDPCRARIVSVPLPESDRRFGDVILHDGERRGERELNAGKVPIFDELALVSRGTYETWKVTLECAHPSERDEILALFEGVDGAVEDWTEHLTCLCAQCSAGVPHDDHPAPPAVPWQAVRKIGIAVPDERELDRLRPLGRWRRGVRAARRVL